MMVSESRRRSLASAALASALAISLGAAAAVAQDPSASPMVDALAGDSEPATEIEILDFAFPADITVGAGSTVQWHNADPVSHTVTATDGAFDSGRVEPDTTFEQSFTEPGVYAYSCLFHPAMTGTITVTSAIDDAAASPGTGLDGSPSPLPEATVLNRQPVHDTDPYGVGGVALTVLAPEDWNVEGGPVWRPQYSNLASYEGRITSPDRYQGVEFFPLYPQIWADGGITFFPEGSNYLGNEVRPPIRDAAAFIERLILPAHRSAFSPVIVDREPLPDLATAYAQRSLPGTDAVAERVLTEHFVDGERMLEEFTVVLTFTPNPALPGTVSWTPQQLFSIRAPADEFEAARPILQAIATSPVVDPDWYTGYQYVLGLSIQNGLDAIRTAGTISEIVAAANADITDTINAGYREWQAVNDRIHVAASQAIRGVEIYSDPWDGGTLELPDGYEYVYGSAEGGVILTNEPAFDPILSFPEQTWESLVVER